VVEVVLDKPAVDIDKFLKKVRKAREAANETAEQIEFELVRFNGENAALDLNVDWSHETVWATRQQIASLFGRDADTIGEHIASLYAEGELERDATTGKFPVVRLEGGRQVSREIEHFNLDVILSVGYRVSSVKATEFRKWATQTLRRYITDGFALNEGRLRNDPRALRDLAAKVRALRSEEIQIYEAVRDCFKVASMDYDASSPAVRTFYARLQDKFLFAITGKTASEIILDRADGTKQNMGVTACKGAMPKKPETKVGKNYLQADEIYVLPILCEQFLLYAESKAIRGQSMTMADLSAKLDQLLETNEYAVFPGYRDYLKDRAMEHAEIEWHRWSDAVARGAMLPAA
jgi:hypothetical protein